MALPPASVLPSVLLALTVALLLTLAAGESDACPDALADLGPLDIPAISNGTIAVGVCAPLSTKCTELEGCSVCEKWGNEDGTTGAICLGAAVTKIDEDADDITIYYNGGDVVASPSDPSLNGPRETVLTLRCSPDFTYDFDDPTMKDGHEEDKPYVYRISVGIAELCNDEDPTPSNATGTDDPLKPKNHPNEYPDIMKWTALGAAIGAIVVGLLWVFFGYRLLRVVMFLNGFVSFFYITYTVLNITTTLDIWIMTLIAAIVGVLGGLLMFILLKIGIFIIGLLAGIALAAMVINLTPLNGLLQTIDVSYTAYQAILISIILGFGIIVGIMALVLRRPLMVVATSMAGSFMVADGIDELGSLGLDVDILKIVRGDDEIKEYDSSNWKMYVTFAGILLLAFIGIFIQFKYTARKKKKAKKSKYREEDYPLLVQEQQ